MALSTNARLWRDAREAGSRDGRRPLARRIGTSRTVITAFVSGGSKTVLKELSRLWVERHGRRAASEISALLRRPVLVDDLFPGWDQPIERPLTAEESRSMRLAVATRSKVLTPQQRAVIRRTFGCSGQPWPLARVATAMGITRERARQIETAALRKLQIRLPVEAHTSAIGRRRRARLLLALLTRD